MFMVGLSAADTKVRLESVPSDLLPRWSTVQQELSNQCKLVFQARQSKSYAWNRKALRVVHARLVSLANLRIVMALRLFGDLAV